MGVGVGVGVGVCAGVCRCLCGACVCASLGWVYTSRAFSIIFNIF